MGLDGGQAGELEGSYERWEVRATAIGEGAGSRRLRVLDGGDPARGAALASRARYEDALHAAGRAGDGT